MNRTMVLAILFAIGGVAFSSHISTAASLPRIGNITAEHALIEKTQAGRCHSWRRECAIRWGWGGSRFRRCLARRGCL
jgi:hypothetical protein